MHAYKFHNQWAASMSVCFLTLPPPRNEGKAHTIWCFDSNMTEAWFCQLPCYSNYTLHIKLPHNSLFPVSAQQGESPGRELSQRGEEGALIAMEMGSTAPHAGRLWKPWTQGTGYDIIQAFSAASCSGTWRCRAAEKRKGGFVWVRLPLNQLLRLQLGCLNGMAGNLLPPQKPKTHKCKHTHAQASGLLELLNG